MLKDHKLHQEWQHSEQNEHRPDDVVPPRVEDEPQGEKAAEQVHNDLKQVELGENGHNTCSNDHHQEFEKAHAHHGVGNSN